MKTGEILRRLREEEGYNIDNMRFQAWRQRNLIKTNGFFYRWYEWTEEDYESIKKFVEYLNRGYRLRVASAKAYDECFTDYI